MRFVKIADLLKYLTSVNCRSATGWEYADILVIIHSRPAFSPGICPSQNAVAVSRIIQQLWLIPHKHFGADGKDLFILPNGIIQSFHKSSFYSGIVVQQDHIGASCLPDSQIHRMTEAGVLRQGDQTHLRFSPLFCRCLFFATPFAVQIFHAPVSRTIVYDQHFIFRCIFLSLTQGGHAFR